MAADPVWAELVATTVESSIAAKRAFHEQVSPALVDAALDTAAALRAGGKVLLFGNGGSAADAQHIAAEFVNRLEQDRPALAALALTTDTSALTAIANDHDFADVFRRQVEALGRAGDVAVGITTSGSSENVRRALVAASERDMLTIGFLGRDGGKCRAVCRHPLVVPHRSTQRIQEVHILMGHLLAAIVERAVLGGAGEETV